MSTLLILILAPCLLAIPMQDAGKDSETSAEPGDQQIMEGDIIMTPEEIAAIEHGQDPTTVRQNRKRKLTRWTDYRWPGGIVPYTVNQSLKRGWWASWVLGKSKSEKAIADAIKEWQDKTCVRFKPRTKEDNYVEFTLGKGCKSPIGYRSNGGKQSIYLTLTCLQKEVLHEIGHILGFFHEQSRTDRDDYVEIITDNIETGKESQFKKYGHGYIDSLGVPYDYKSIMHYPKGAFAKRPGLVTIRAKKPGVTFGDVKHLSELDVKAMKLFYNCGS